jgi:hypothetical protein
MTVLWFLVSFFPYLEKGQQNVVLFGQNRSNERFQKVKE